MKQSIIRYTYAPALMIIMGCCLLFMSFSPARAQNTPGLVIDQVVATVGSNVILLSDIENEYIQTMLQGYATGGEELRCRIIEELLFQKLMLDQADIDSVTVTDQQVENEIDRRMRYFIAQIGSKEKLEEYFGKSMTEIKKDLGSRIRDNMLIQEVQAKIIANVKVTPAEIHDFFEKIPADSLPLINSEYEIAQIVKKPPVSQEEIDLVKEKLDGIRERIVKGEDFAIMANLYSMDPGSMTKGGNLGLIGRGETYTEFEAAAFSLKAGEVSPIVRTEKGYHLIKLLERRGEYVNVQHILIIPKASVADLAKAKKELEHIASLIVMDSLTFEQAAALHSDDPTKNNNGLLINAASGTSFFEPAEIDPSMFFIIDKLQVGEMSPVTPFTNESDQRQVYRILYLKSRTLPHKANLKDDYPKIQNMVLMTKQSEAMNKWIQNKSQNTYIQIAPDFMNCDFMYDWSSMLQQ